MSFREFHSSLTPGAKSYTLLGRAECETFRKRRRRERGRGRGRDRGGGGERESRSSPARSRVSSEKPALEQTRVRRCGRCSVRGYTDEATNAFCSGIGTEPTSLCSFLSLSLSLARPFAHLPPVPRAAIRVYERLLYNGAGIITVEAFQKNGRDYN